MEGSRRLGSFFHPPSWETHRYIYLHACPGVVGGHARAHVPSTVRPVALSCLHCLVCIFRHIAHTSSLGVHMLTCNKHAQKDNTPYTSTCTYTHVQRYKHTYMHAVHHIQTQMHFIQTHSTIITYTHACPYTSVKQGRDILA